MTPMTNKVIRMRTSQTMHSITNARPHTKKVRKEDPYRETSVYLKQFERYAWRAHVARHEDDTHKLPRIVKTIIENYETYRKQRIHAKVEYYTIARYLHQYHRKDTPQTREQVFLWYKQHENDRIHTNRKMHAVLTMPSGAIILRTA